MSIHTVAELEAHTGLTDDGQFSTYLDKAEAAVAAGIGATTLVQQDPTTYVLYPQRMTRVVMNEANRPWLSVSDISSHQGTALDATSAIVEPWRLGYYDDTNPYYEPFTLGSVWTFTLIAGYALSADMPLHLSLACLNAADWVRQVKPDSNVSAETIGDYSYTRRQAPGSFEQYLPSSSVALLRPFIRPDRMY